jgi:hypothetical protein
MRVIEHLLKAVCDAAIFNPDVQVAPACILWPDRDRQWKAIIPRLQNEMPELLVLGDYDPERKTGPAIWLRCVIARKVDDIPFSEDITPILYLPGVSRQDLRAVESCPESLKPLAELQYLGVIWSQVNGKDWTILTFLKSDQDGLGVELETWVMISPRLIWQQESNPRPFSVWGKCGEKHFPRRDAENSTWKLSTHCK